MDLPVNQESFLKLIQANRGIIFKICQSYCHNRDDREDLAQEIIYQLWKSGHRFDNNFTFSTWMYRVALNVAISFYRNNKKAGATIAFEEEHNAVEDPLPGSPGLEEQLQQMQELIRQLKELDRALILLYLESKSHREISEIMGISESNVGTRINRIKDKLRQKFSNLKE